MLKNIREKLRLTKLKKYKNENKIMFLLSPDHGNLGDQMIAVATKKLLEDKYTDKKIIEVTRKSYIKNKRIIKNIISEGDIVILPGGGNLGDVWFGEEVSRREILSDYRKNHIIIMPQTIKFISEKEKNISKDIYSKVENLTIVAREEESFKLGKEIFSKNKILLSPDSVFYLEDTYTKKLSKNRDGAIFLMRQDQEKIIDSHVVEKIKGKFKLENITYKISDTVIKSKGKINFKNREEICLNLLKEISKHKLIITDRLHGMIFGIITNTPVIVFGSSTPKTRGTLKWISHLDYVSYIEDSNDFKVIEKEIKRLMNLKVIKKGYIIKEKLKDVFKNL